MRRKFKFGAAEKKERAKSVENEQKGNEGLKEFV